MVGESWIPLVPISHGISYHMRHYWRKIPAQNYARGQGYRNTLSCTSSDDDVGFPWMDITIHVDVATAAVLLSHHNKPIITIGATIENVPTASCTSDGEKSSLGWRVHQMSTVFRTLRWRFSVVDWRASDDGMTFKTSIYLMNDFPSSCNGHANTHGFVCHPGKSVEMIPPNYVHVQSNASVVTPWWFPCVVVVLEMCNLRSLIPSVDNMFCTNLIEKCTVSIFCTPES